MKPGSKRRLSPAFSRLGHRVEAGKSLAHFRTREGKRWGLGVRNGHLHAETKSCVVGLKTGLIWPILGLVSRVLCLWGFGPGSFRQCWASERETKSVLRLGRVRPGSRGQFTREGLSKSRVLGLGHRA